MKFKNKKQQRSRTSYIELCTHKPTRLQNPKTSTKSSIS